MDEYRKTQLKELMKYTISTSVDDGKSALNQMAGFNKKIDGDIAIEEQKQEQIW